MLRWKSWILSSNGTLQHKKVLQRGIKLKLNVQMSEAFENLKNSQFFVFHGP